MELKHNLENFELTQLNINFLAIKALFIIEDCFSVLTKQSL